VRNGPAFFIAKMELVDTLPGSTIIHSPGKIPDM